MVVIETGEQGYAERVLAEQLDITVGETVADYFAGSTFSQIGFEVGLSLD